MRTKNFPGNKQARRIAAYNRKEGDAEKYGELMEDRDVIPEEIKRKALLVVKEMAVLKERIAKGGKKITKKDRSAQAPFRRQ